MGPERLLSLAIHATTERRASDHPPPTASRTSGQKVMPAWVHREAVLRNAFLLDSTEVTIPAKVAGSERAGPSRKSLVMKKSHASWPMGPEGPRRRPDDGRNWWDQAGPGPEGDHRQRGPERSGGLAFPGQQLVSDQIATGDPMTTTPAGQGVVTMTCPQNVQFVSWDQTGLRRRRRRLTRNKG